MNASSKVGVTHSDQLCIFIQFNLAYVRSIADKSKCSKSFQDNCNAM